MLKKFWQMFVSSPSLGVALAKVLVPLIGIIILIIVSLLGYGDSIPEKYRWITKIFQ